MSKTASSALRQAFQLYWQQGDRPMSCRFPSEVGGQYRVSMRLRHMTGAIAVDAEGRQEFSDG